MGYIEKFADVLIAHSESKVYKEAMLEWVYQGETIKKPNNCICGHAILQNLVVKNKLNNNELTIGNCCIHKFGVKREHYNKSRVEYFRFAWGKTKTPQEREFLRSLIENMRRYKASFRLTGRQTKWLEAITGTPYRWKHGTYIPAETSPGRVLTKGGGGMKCSICGEEGFVNYDQLVDHILGTADDKHKNARVYATKKLASLKKAPKGASND